MNRFPIYRASFIVAALSLPEPMDPTPIAFVVWFAGIVKKLSAAHVHWCRPTTRAKAAKTVPYMSIFSVFKSPQKDVIVTYDEDDNISLIYVLEA